MATAVIMPKAGITVESCIIGQWEKKVGDMVKVGDVLFSYETDKASFECESTAEGELLEIFFGDGDEVACLENVCAIGKHGEDVSALRPGGSNDASPAAEPAPVDSAANAAPQVEHRSVAAPASSNGSAGVANVGSFLAGVSPRARNLAAREGIDLMAAAASGPKGRVIERDVLALIRGGAAATPRVAESIPAAPAAPTPVTIPTPAPGDTYEDIPFSGIRKAISRSMATSLSTMAQLTHNFSFDATQLLEYRKAFKGYEGDFAGITIGDMILFAVSRTLPECPDLNAHMYDDSSIRRFHHVNLGVATDTERGLMVPTIFHAERKSLLEISQEVKALAAEAREGRISPDKLTGGTFTVSNLGSFGVESFTPVINPPQTGLIGVCTTVDRIRRKEDGTIEAYPAMTLSLTYDHRAIDGAPASRFMMLLCKRLEQFATLLSM